jgi:hypothetical protein
MDGSDLPFYSDRNAGPEGNGFPITLVERIGDYLQAGGFVVGERSRDGGGLSIERGGRLAWFSSDETFIDRDDVGTDFSFLILIILRVALQDHQKSLPVQSIIPN